MEKPLGMKPIFGVGSEEGGATFEAKPSEAKCVVIYDTSNMAYRAAHAHKSLTTQDGRPSGHVYGAIQQVLSFCRKLTNEFGIAGSIHQHFATDSFDCFRYDIYSNYKANRQDKLGYSPVEDVWKMACFIPKATVYGCSGYEADDVIAALVRVHRNRANRVIVVSSDRDLWQLMDGNTVRIYAHTLKRFVTRADLIEHFHGLAFPGGIALMKAVFGDASDNIPPAVPRLRKKPVVPAIQKLAERGKATYEEFTAFLKANTYETWAAALWDNRDVLKRNMQLTKLYDRIKPKRQSKRVRNADMLVEYLETFDIKSVIDKCRTFEE